ncbi:hypothetical protein [Alteromonas sp. MMG017]|uniref:hypothetical protein n=1 Tax=Alteromonas sp. MMG017 TaxID=2822692 RepID=UPI001FFD8262|nr:hypothetical protein [Alteromonas sp. MMG017]
MRLTVQMAASFSQIKNINAQSFFLSALTINRMLASIVFKKTKGTGFAYNKALKTTPFGRSDAYTRGGFAIMPHASAPLSFKLGVIYLQHKKVGITVTFQHQGCFARLSLRVTFSVVSTALATRFSQTP